MRSKNRNLTETISIIVILLILVGIFWLRGDFINGLLQTQVAILPSRTIRSTVENISTAVTHIEASVIPTPGTKLPVLVTPGMAAPIVESEKPVITVTETIFLPGIMKSGPLQVSKQNPRYFETNGKVVLLVGSHTWLNLQDGGLVDPPPVFDYETYLDFLVTQNHNFFRLWMWEQAKWLVEWEGPFYLTPMPYKRTGPGKALDGKPKFDLTKLDQAYFDRMRQRVMMAQERGIYVSIMLFDGWSIEYPKDGIRLDNPWRGHPYNGSNNINGIDGDVNGNESGEETHTLAEPRVTVLQEAYVRKVVESVNDLDNVLYEISNESPGNSEAWQYHMINLIKEYEAKLGKQHPVGMTVEWPGSDNADLFASPADWISPSGDINNPMVGDGQKVVLNDTDHLCGICGDRVFVWKSFVNGLNPIFMDQYDDSFKLYGGGYDMNNTNDVSLRKNLGYVRAYAERMDLVKMTPQGELASSGYCLANTGEAGAEYLVYLPEGGKVNVNLKSTPGSMKVEWFNPQDGTQMTSGNVEGGRMQTFTSPFGGDAVLYLTK